MTRIMGEGESGYSYGVAGRVTLLQLQWAVAYAIPYRAARSLQDAAALAASVGAQAQGYSGTGFDKVPIDTEMVIKHFRQQGRSPSEIDHLNWLLELAVARNERNRNGKGSIDSLVKP